MTSLASFDPDHALAILLQARLNEEAKKEAEKVKNKQTSSLPSRPETGKSKIQNGSSLTSPEWEVTDPCPDIHGLFLAFNDRFFWGRLQTVEVRWSPQMTSCAGVCVYEGRNGLCSVRLSAPLLKLRPRSDLVETLLHEMIHAFLFVTNNNRDRDGHGPEFHKHMNRINKEAGTNITVYHSFHAEVKLYQQHWWRCQGPCQSRPPFFGMLKRAKNRAPGPNDQWWADHQARCGGVFVKVREPEGFKKKGKKEKAVKPQDGGNISDFFKKPPFTTKKPATVTVNSNKVGSNIFGFNNFPSNSASNTRVSTPVTNVSNHTTGFGDQFSSGKSSKGKPATSVDEGGHVLGHRISKVNGNPLKSVREGTLANRGGGTLVVTGSQGKQTEKIQVPDEKLRIDQFKVFSGAGFTLGSSSSVNDRSRSRLLSLGQEEPVQKKRKVNGNSLESKEDNVSNKNKNERMCKCSVCGGSVSREEVDMHLESCMGLKNVFNNSFVEDNADEKEIIDINEKYKEILCPVCNQSDGEDINAHLDVCLNTSGFLNLLDDSPVEISNSVITTPFSNKNKSTSPIPNLNDSDIEIIEPEGRVACPICGMRFGESKINDHVNTCLDSEN